MRPWLATVAALAVCSPVAALADHMNGEFFGLGEWADYSLYLSQQGRTVEVDILACGESVLELDGQSDGGDNAQGQVFVVDNDGEGTFWLQWTPDMVLVMMDLDGTRYEAAFGTRPSANSCGQGEPHDAPDDASDDQADDHAHDHADEQTLEQQADTADERGAAETGEAGDGGGPLPNF